MGKRTAATVVDLATFRKQREEAARESRASTPPPVMVVVPMWMWIPVWAIP